MALKFHGVDFLHLDSSFNEDELLVRRTAREFVEDNLTPIIEDCFREGRFPRESGEEPAMRVCRPVPRKARVS